MSYDPNSQDAMFSRIIHRLDSLDAKLDRIEVQTIKTNGRVTALDRWKDVLTAKAVAIALTVSSVFAVLSWVVRNLL